MRDALWMSNPKTSALRNCLSADARRAHRENVIARNESGTAEVPLDDASDHLVVFVSIYIGLMGFDLLADFWWLIFVAYLLISSDPTS